MKLSIVLTRVLLAATMVCLAFIAPMLSSGSVANAAIEAVQFEDPATRERYHNLIAELRCLVCQNQTLADSDADLAKDLRRKTAEMLAAGNSDQQILDYMRDRYGDFVLYRPPFSLGTALIWLGPFLLLIIASTALVINIRRRQRENGVNTPDTAREAQRIKARKLMESTPDLTRSSEHPKK